MWERGLCTLRSQDGSALHIVILIISLWSLAEGNSPFCPPGISRWQLLKQLFSQTWNFAAPVSNCLFSQWILFAIIPV